MKLHNFNSLKYLNAHEDVRLALISAFEDDSGDGTSFSATLENMAKTPSIIQLAKETGLSPETLCQSLFEEIKDVCLSQTTLERIRSGREKTYTLEEVEKNLNNY